MTQKIVLDAKVRKNLRKLADYLESLPKSYKHFDMSVHSAHWGSCDLPMEEDLFMVKDPKGFLHNCGSVACAIGHGPAAGIKMLPDEFEINKFMSGREYASIHWYRYAKRVFGEDCDGFKYGEFLFGGGWSDVDNHPWGAAARIRYLLDTGKTLPHGAEYDREVAKAKYAPYRKGSRSEIRAKIDAKLAPKETANA